MALDEAQVRRATSALLKHVKISTAAKPSLLEEGEVILAQISLHKIPDKVTAKPHRIEIPHPLRQQDDCDMCLFVKDNAKAWIKEMIEKEPVAGLAKVKLVFPLAYLFVGTDPMLLPSGNPFKCHEEVFSFLFAAYDPT